MNWFTKETESQILKSNLWLPKEMSEESDKLGMWLTYNIYYIENK